MSALERSAVLTLLGVLVVACASAPPPDRLPEQKTITSAPEMQRPFESQVAAPAAPPAEGAVRYVGRFDGRDPGGPWMAWPGTSVLVRFEGTGVTASTNQGATFSGPSRYDVTVDGVLLSNTWVVTNGTHDHVLVSGLSPGVHELELWRRTAGFSGATQFRGFTIHGGRLLPSSPPKSRRIEFVGDSSINGYGIECTSAYDAFAAQTQNEHKAYPALVSAALDAEHSNVAFSGKGVLRNANTEDKDTFSALYGLSMPEDPASSWSFHGPWVPQLVWIALGGNDFVATGNRPPPDATAFRGVYRDLITLVRSKNPQARIVCTVEGRMTDAEPAGYKAFTSMTTAIAAVVREMNQSGDSNVHYFELPRADGSGKNGAPDMNGCDRHTNVAYHQRAAALATAKIKAIMSW